MADLDYFGRETGFNTPQAAVHDWVRRHPDQATREVVVTDTKDHGATAFILRRDDTARTRLRVDKSEKGWFVGGYQACAVNNPMR